MSKPIAIILTTEFGHWSLTLAMKEILEKEGFSTSQIKKEGVINELYKIIYRSAPKQNEHVYQLVAKNKTIRSWILEGLAIKNKNLVSQLKKMSPQVVISNYYEYVPILKEIKEKCNCPVFNFMANPTTQVEEMELSPHAQNIVFDKESVKPNTLTQDNYKIFPLGWIVQDKFEAEYDQNEIRKKLSLNNMITLLFVSGSLGSPADLNIFKSLLQLDLPIQILYACGNNKLLINKLERVVKNKKLKKSIVKLFGFTENIHLYLQASDLVIGKAGPNTLFETVATKTPFFASHHLPGQEDGNLELIQKYQLGWVEEEDNKATNKILHLVNNPEKINMFNSSLARMASHNKIAKEKFGELVKAAVKNNQKI
ncbi:MAG: Putative glycosyl transferase [Microgenomates bacterium 39_7]|nr:MAG: Putative glycosyl transferase [Microgenomates bacterium 39_7]